MRNLIILFTLMLLTFSCIIDKNPIDLGNGSLSIKTEKNKYSWQQGEDNQRIIVQGSLKNRSDETYYSRIGARSGPPEQDQLTIAGNSAGRIEKYNNSDNSWYEINITAFLIEGSRFVPLKPSGVYSIYADLTIEKEGEERGKYRLRIDYYDKSDPNENEKPFKDYSNIFEIM